MQKQTLLGRANRVRDKPEFYPVGSRHFVRLFSTYPSDTPSDVVLWEEKNPMQSNNSKKTFRPETEEKGRKRNSQKKQAAAAGVAMTAIAVILLGAGIGYSVQRAGKDREHFPGGNAEQCEQRAERRDGIGGNESGTVKPEYCRQSEKA